MVAVSDTSVGWMSIRKWFFLMKASLRDLEQCVDKIVVIVFTFYISAGASNSFGSVIAADNEHQNQENPCAHVLSCTLHNITLIQYTDRYVSILANITREISKTVHTFHILSTSHP